ASPRSGGMVEVETMSAAAQERMHAGLPDLLAEVRARRRRRRALRAGVGLVFVGLVVRTFWPEGAAPPPAAAPDRSVAAVPTPEIVGDDPTVLARCLLPTHERPDWFVDDEGLRGLLRAADLPDGLVRIGKRVTFAAGVVAASVSEAP
ncbi:MAG: hypothetical protein JNK15_21305, partial [Planctomycetes bacterium]|nr:hypothetical protein [Planctomycetota bacterium]